MSSPRLIVLTHSVPWTSAISRNFPRANQSWVLNADALIEASFECRGSAAIVEIPTTGIDEFCVEIAELVNNSGQLRLFALGDRELLNWQPLLAAAGFTSWYWSLLQLPELILAVARHHSSIPTVIQSTETRVWSELPWPGAATDRQA